MTTQHTPGPWLVETRKHVHAIKDSNGQDLTYQDTEPQPDAGSVTSRGRSASETFANARLIAAAPDLLSALNLLLDKLHAHCPGLIDCEYTSAEITKAEMAVAKAKGIA